MSDDQWTPVGRRLLRHFRWAERAWRWTPQPWRQRTAALVGRTFSPDLDDSVRIWHALQTFTQCSDQQAHVWLARYFASQGIFAADLHGYPSLDAHWAEHKVRCDDREVLGRLGEGGLLLTYHSFHHNRLGSFLGLSGARVFAIAATEDNSPLKPWTGGYMRKINGGSEALFGGGRYVFTDNLRGLLRDSREVLRRGDLLASLADNYSDSPTAAPVDLLGRRMRIATGSIELALEAGVPITLALFYSDLRGGYRCRLRRLEGMTDSAEVARVYMEQLLAWCADDPHAWQGWAWWDHMPFTPGLEAQGLERQATAPARYAASLPRRTLAQRILLKLDALELKVRPLSP
jgi:lauroyl/myristoyl acyltransferase